jgi:hypothetical protein
MCLQAVHKFTRMFLAGCLVFAGLVAGVHAELNFRASVEPSQVYPGERIIYRLTISSSSRQKEYNPSHPDFGKLKVLSGPSGSSQYFNKNGEVRIIQSWDWILTASEPGRYVIGPSRLRSGNQSYQTELLRVVVKPQSEAGLPEDLRGEKLISGQTKDPAENRKLRNRLFIRPLVSNRTPFVGEPVILAYVLYNDGMPLGDIQFASFPEVEGALNEELFKVQRLEMEKVTHNGKTYQAIGLYTHAVTPTRPGQQIVSGFEMAGILNKSSARRSRSLFGNPLDMGLRIHLPTPEINLSVQQVPDVGMPDEFTGTVGDFSMSVELDRTEVTLDDLITLQVRLSGRGAIDLANPPGLDLGDHFSMAGDSVEVNRRKSIEDVSGEKIFEYILRPNRPGRLQLPGISYVLFNPYSAEFRTLVSEPIQVSIAPGQAPSLDVLDPALSAGESKSGHPSGLAYLRPMLDLKLGRTEALAGHPLFWLFHLAGAIALVVAWKLDNRRLRRDPGRERRGRAWRNFEKRVRHIEREISTSGNLTQAAGNLESAVRNFIADHFDLAADGLTRPMIEDRLVASSLGSQKVNRLCELMERCTSSRYAPQSIDGPIDLKQCCREFSAILREVRT